jgi:hypothetical protein
MGIAVNFYNKKHDSETTSMSYSTMMNILEDVNLPPMVDYSVRIPANKVVKAFEDFLHVWNKTENFDKEKQFIKQILNDYRKMVMRGKKPTHFGGA